MGNVEREAMKDACPDTVVMPHYGLKSDCKAGPKAGADAVHDGDITFLIPVLFEDRSFPSDLDARF